MTPRESVSDHIVIGNVFDNYFAIDIADFLHQQRDIDDLVSLKTFANTEFCPRFTLADTKDIRFTGKMLENKTVIVVSVHNDWMSRNELAMRNMILARAAKDNAARRVVLVEPDLFYAAQDRGPGDDQGKTKEPRSAEDRHKFNGQPFTSRLYAQLLKTSGFDAVVTIHNHSASCQHIYETTFGRENFFNLHPNSLYHNYLSTSGIIDPEKTILVAPDEGAREFVATTSTIDKPNYPVIFFRKTRKGERQVELEYDERSGLSLHQIKGRHVVILDDMVRSGRTVMDCCRELNKYSPSRIVCMVTHFFSSDEIKRNLSIGCIDEIITTNTLPTILNRDNQGRLRKKMAVLKINKWIANYLNEFLHLGVSIEPPLYLEDMSDKNPRWRIQNHP